MFRGTIQIKEALSCNSNAKKLKELCRPCGRAMGGTMNHNNFEINDLYD